MRPTPSASTSPEPFRQPYSPSLTDGPSPAKRRKIARSGPSSSSSIRASSVFCHTSPEDPQLDAERRASSVRLLNTWSALKEKYDRPLHKDDIVDLRSGALLKDRGVLSSDPRTWDIGCFANVDDAVDQESAGNSVVDERDEMGAWESESGLYAQFARVRVSPVRELNPLDAQDLQDFLAAENARRVAQGIDDDDVDNDVAGDETVSPSVQRNSSHIQLQRSCSTESVIDVEAGSVLVISSSESDDELCGYDDAVGEGALLWRIDENVDHSDPVIMTPGHAPRRSVQQFPQSQVPTQLQTPPLSRSLSVPVACTPPSLAITPKTSLSTPPRSHRHRQHLSDPFVSSSPETSTSIASKSDVSRHSSFVPDKNIAVLLREMNITPSKRRPEVVLPRRREKLIDPQKTQSCMSGPLDFTEESRSSSPHSQEHIRQRSFSQPHNTARSSINNSSKFKTSGKRKRIPADDCVNGFTSGGCPGDCVDEFTSRDCPRPSQPPVDTWPGIQPDLRMHLAQIGLSLFSMASIPNGWQYPPLQQENVMPSSTYGSTFPWSFSSPFASPSTSPGAQPPPTSPLTVSTSRVNPSPQNSPTRIASHRLRCHMGCDPAKRS